MRRLSFILIMALGLQAQTFNVSTTAELRTALTNAAQNGEDDTIILADGTYKTTDDSGGTFKYLDNEVYNLTLQGSSRDNVILSGDGQDQIFNMQSPYESRLRIEKISFIDGGPVLDGNNYIVNDGGAISTQSSHIDVIDCNFTHNRARHGGGIYGINATIDVNNSVFENNFAVNDGGGFSTGGGDRFSTVKNSTFINNKVFPGELTSFTGEGGGFYTQATVSVESSTFSNNGAQYAGGGFYAFVAIVKDTNFTDNSVYDVNTTYVRGHGGGFFTGNASIENSIFQSNIASDGGGFATSYNASNIYISNSIFRDNKAFSASDSIGYGGDTSYTGGAAFNVSSGLVVEKTVIEKNYAERYGAAFCAGLDAVIVNSIIVDNRSDDATSDADTIHVGKVYMSNSIVSKNDSSFHVISSSSTVDSPSIIKNSVFMDNNGSDVSAASDVVINFLNNYIDLSNVNVQKLVSDNIFNNVTLGFVDADNGDYNLTASSDFIDAGTKKYADNFIVDSVNYLATDYADNNRSVGANMDIGIYEYTTTKPTLNDINITGTKKQFQELTFGVDYTLASGRSIQSVEFDYLNDGTYTTDNIHSFDKVRTYKVNIKVTDDAGEFSTTSVSVKIDALPFADMTNEQKYKEAIQSDYYSDIITIIEDEISTANTSGHELGLYDGKVYVQNHLAEFNLTTLESCNQSLEDMNTTATQVGIDTGKAYVQNNLAEFNLTTLESCNQSLEDMNTTATQVGIDTGKAYVQNNLAEFSLVTLTDKVAAVNSAIAETNTTATAAGILSGKQMVIDSPEAYGLILQSDLNSSVTDALNKGIASGKKYVLDNLEEFSLVAKADIDFTATDIASLGTGWSLVSTPFAISDLSIFDSVNIIWVYNNTTGKWAAYSSDATIKQKIEDKADVDTLTTIPAGSAIWIMK